MIRIIVKDALDGICKIHDVFQRKMCDFLISPPAKIQKFQLFAQNDPIKLFCSDRNMKRIRGCLWDSRTDDRLFMLVEKVFTGDKDRFGDIFNFQDIPLFK